jgi:hypothetical protein
MKCLNSAFSAQCSRVIIQVGEVKIYVAEVEALKKKERGNETLFTTKVGFIKLVEKLIWVPLILFCKISFPVMHLMPFYVKTSCSRPLIARLYR